MVSLLEHAAFEYMRSCFYGSDLYPAAVFIKYSKYFPYKKKIEKKNFKYVKKRKILNNLHQGNPKLTEP